jgi:hypothetical protein
VLWRYVCYHNLERKGCWFHLPLLGLAASLMCLPAMVSSLRLQLEASVRSSSGKVPAECRFVKPVRSARLRPVLDGLSFVAQKNEAPLPSEGTGSGSIFGTFLRPTPARRCHVRMVRLDVKQSLRRTSVGLQGFFVIGDVISMLLYE